MQMQRFSTHAVNWWTLEWFIRLRANGCNVVGCYMLHPFATLLHVVACCCAKFETGQLFQPTTPNISFVPWSPKRNNVGSVWTALPTLLGPRTLIAHGLQRLMVCILPTMHCRSQHCWELLHPFAHHCQHARSLSQSYDPFLALKIFPFSFWHFLWQHYCK